jgi:hypothetical protein
MDAKTSKTSLSLALGKVHIDILDSVRPRLSKNNRSEAACMLIELGHSVLSAHDLHLNLAAGRQIQEILSRLRLSHISTEHV